MPMSLDEDARGGRARVEDASGASRLAWLWTVAAVGCLVAAAVFFARGDTDKTFVAAVLGVIAWFLNVRSELRRKTLEAEREAFVERDDAEEDERE